MALLLLLEGIEKKHLTFAVFLSQLWHLTRRAQKAEKLLASVRREEKKRRQIPQSICAVRHEFRVKSFLAHVRILVLIESCIAIAPEHSFRKL